MLLWLTYPSKRSVGLDLGQPGHGQKMRPDAAACVGVVVGWAEAVPLGCKAKGGAEGCGSGGCPWCG
jgi:hypothetical protein